VAERIDPDAVHDWELVRRVIARTDVRILGQVVDQDMPEQSFNVLHVLLHAPQRRMPMTQLAREVLMSSGGFTKLADRLGRDGLIDRRGSEDDRRVVYAALTTEGIRVAKAAERRYHAALRDLLFDVIGPDDLHLIADRLRALDNEAGTATETALPAGRDPSMPERRSGRSAADGRNRAVAAVPNQAF
jgi:DNA-binding MarR family transcriptional regulator